MSIYVTGDTHGDINVHKLTLDAFPVQSLLSHRDYLIVLGDFGGVWTGTNEDNKTLDWHNKKRYVTLFIDGNHENHDALERFPIELWNGGKIHRIRPNIIHLMRGQIYTIDGLRIFTFGGALSVDKVYRIPHVSWWPQELPSKAEIDEALENLKKHDFTVDVVLTHTAPARVCEQLTAYIMDDPMCRVLDEFERRISFNKWYFGHYHLDRDSDDKFTALFHRILPIDLQAIRQSYRDKMALAAQDPHFCKDVDEAMRDFSVVDQETAIKKSSSHHKVAKDEYGRTLSKRLEEIDRDLLGSTVPWRDIRKLNNDD